MQFSHPKHKCYHNNRENCIDLLHQHIAFIYLLHPYYYYPINAKDVKAFMPMFKPQHDNNQERTTIVNQQDM
jgi:hypothetical protein